MRGRAGEVSITNDGDKGDKRCICRRQGREEEGGRLRAIASADRCGSCKRPDRKGETKRLIGKNSARIGSSSGELKVRNVANQLATAATTTKQKQMKKSKRAIPTPNEVKQEGTVGGERGEGAMSNRRGSQCQ